MSDGWFRCSLEIDGWPGIGRPFPKKQTGIMIFCCIMYYGGRVKLENKMLDENFGRNLSSFIYY
jgi:hypothetical protein